MNMMHVTIKTCRFEEEIAFYERYLGLTIQRDMRPLGKDLVFLGENERSTMVEVIREPSAQDSGNDHLSIGFRTGDLASAKEALVSAGFEPTPFVTPEPGVQFFFVKDPAGVRVQFVQESHIEG